MSDTWIDPVADELAADIVRDQQLAEHERRLYVLENEMRELLAWRQAIYHGSRPFARPYVHGWQTYPGTIDPE